MTETELASQPTPQTRQKSRKKKVTVYLPEEWAAELEKLAADRGAAVSAVVRDLVYEFLRGAKR